MEDWHKILGHCNLKDVLIVESVVDGMKITEKEKFDCQVCIKGKMSQYRSREPDKRATCPFELVHCDLAGPVDPVARDGFKYAISFVDDYTGIIMVYFMKQKSDTTSATEKFLADSMPYAKVKTIRTDNGTEFTCESFRSLLVKNQIKHEKSAPYSPHQNGTVERSWRSIFDMARCLLLEAKLPKEFWSYAVMASVHIRNRCYNPRTGKTPYEAVTGQKPNLSTMHIFGTVCYAYVQDKKKLDPRSEKGIFLGYDKGSPAYLVYVAEKNVVRRVRCVKFTDKFSGKKEIVNDEYDSENVYTEVPENENEVENCENNETLTDDTLCTGETDNLNRRYPARMHTKPKRFEDYVSDIESDTESVKCTIDYFYKVSDIPMTYQEAVKSSESEK